MSQLKDVEKLLKLDPKNTELLAQRISVIKEKSDTLKTAVIEKFHQIEDAFLREAKVHKLRTLEELNRYWDIYLDDYYHQDSHEWIAEYYIILW